MKAVINQCGYTDKEIDVRVNTLKCYFEELLVYLQNPEEQYILGAIAVLRNCADILKASGLENTRHEVTDGLRSAAQKAKFIRNTTSRYLHYQGFVGGEINTDLFGDAEVYYFSVEAPGKYFITTLEDMLMVFISPEIANYYNRQLDNDVRNILDILHSDTNPNAKMIMGFTYVHENKLTYFKLLDAVSETLLYLYRYKSNNKTLKLSVIQMLSMCISCRIIAEKSGYTLTWNYRAVGVFARNANSCRAISDGTITIDSHLEINDYITWLQHTILPSITDQKSRQEVGRLLRFIEIIQGQANNVLDELSADGRNVRGYEHGRYDIDSNAEREMLQSVAVLCGYLNPMPESTKRIQKLYNPDRNYWIKILKIIGIAIAFVVVVYTAYAIITTIEKNNAENQRDIAIEEKENEQNYITNYLIADNTYLENDESIHPISAGSILLYAPKCGSNIRQSEAKYSIYYNEESNPTESGPVPQNMVALIEVAKKEIGTTARIHLEFKGMTLDGKPANKEDVYQFVYVDKESTQMYYQGTTTYVFPSRLLIENYEEDKNIILPNEKIKVQASAPKGSVVKILYCFNDGIVHEIDGEDGVIQVPDAEPTSSDVLKLSSKVDVNGEIVSTKWVDYKVKYGDDSLVRTVKISYNGIEQVAFAGPNSDKSTSTVSQFTTGSRIHIEAEKQSDVQDIYYAWDREDVWAIYGVNSYDLEVPSVFEEDRNRHYLYVKTRGTDGLLSMEWQCYCFEYETYPTTMKVYYKSKEISEETTVNARPGDVLHVDAFSEEGVSLIGWNLHDRNGKKLTEIMDIKNDSIDIVLPKDIKHNDFVVWIEAVGKNGTANPSLPYNTGWKKYYIHYDPAINTEIMYDNEIIMPGSTIVAKPGKTIHVKASSDAGVAYIGWYMVANGEKITETTDIYSDEIEIKLPVLDIKEYIVFIEAVSNGANNGYNPEHATGWLGVKVRYSE